MFLCNNYLICRTWRDESLEELRYIVFLRKEFKEGLECATRIDIPKMLSFGSLNHL